jgi:hypothetical protein
MCEESLAFLYVGSHWYFCILTDMHWKPLACFSLHMGMVPNVYQCSPTSMAWSLLTSIVITSSAFASVGEGEQGVVGGTNFL